ncbi:MAG: CHAT domain-containing protein [Egibacteraceae bacterium]
MDDSTRLKFFLLEFVSEETWHQSRAVVENHPELLTSAADAALDLMITAARDHGGDADTVAQLEQHRRVLRRCAEVGIPAAFEEVAPSTGQMDTDEAARDSDEENLRLLLLEFVTAESRHEAQRVVGEHPELLSADALDILGRVAEEARRLAEDDTADMLQTRFTLLRRCVEIGVESAFDEDRRTTPSQEDVLELLFELMEASSWEVSAQLLREHPELLQGDTDQALDHLITTTKTHGHLDIAARLEQLRVFLRTRELRAASSDEERHEHEPRHLALLQILYEFIQADSWNESQRIVEEHAELLSDTVDEPMSSLVTAAELEGDREAVEMFRVHRDLLRRCREIGTTSAFQEIRRHRDDASGDDLDAALAAAVEELGESGAPPEIRVAFLGRAAMTLLSRHRATGSGEDLDAAIRIWRDLIRVAPSDSPNYPHKFNQLGIALATRYTLTNEPEDLEAAVDAHRHAVLACPPSFEDLPGLLGNLGNVLMDRHDCTGGHADLDEAIVVYRSAVERASEEANNLTGLLSNLAGALWKRFDLQLDAADLNEAIAMYRSAVEAAGERSDNLLDVQSRLADCLVDRFERQGDVGDLDEAIGIYESTIPQLSQQPELLSVHLAGCGVAWHRRYQHDHQPFSLEQAITAYRRAIAEAPRSSNPTQRVANLAGALIERHKLGERVADLDEAVQAYTSAITASPPGDHQLPRLLHLLGNAFSYRFEHIGETADLDAGLRAQRQAVELLPADAADLPAHTGTLGSRYLARYRAAGNLKDLNAAVEWYERAVTATPVNSPGLPAHLNNWGLGLRTRYDRVGESSDLDRAIQALELATSAASEGSEHLPTYLMNWGTALEARYERTGALTDLDEAIAAYRRAENAIPVGSPGRPALLADLAHGLRARYSNTRQRGDLDEAIRVLEEAREAAQVQWQKRVEWLGGLAASLDQRSDEDGNPSDLDRAIDLYREALELTPTSSPGRSGLCSNFGGSLLKRYERTRTREHRADLDEAIGLFEEAVSGTAEVSPHLPDILNGLAMGLRFRFELDGADEDLAAGVQHYRGSCQRDRVSNPRAVLVAATWWGAWATERAAWSEAVEAYGYGLDAAQGLVGLQFSRQEKETWLRLTKGLASGLAYARAMTRDLQGAVVALERGRAVLLAEALERGSGQAAGVVSFDRIAEQARTAPLVYVAAAAPGGVALVVGTDGGVAEVRLPGLTADALVDQTRRYYLANIERLVLGRDDRWDAVLDILGGWLWRDIMGPVLNAVRPAAEIVLIPAGYLALLPLHAAWTEDPSTATGRRYALDEIGITYSANARALAAARQMAQKVTADSILIVEEPRPVEAGPLDNASVEAVAVERVFASSQPLRDAGAIHTLRHGKATREAVKAVLNKCAVLHLCCHGSANPGEPLAGGLLMANDEMLTVRDVMERRESPARLTVLSACETSMPGADLPDEVIGLPTGLIEAGVAGVIGSLWSVPDLSTAVLMMGYYELWRIDGLEPREALRHAQRWVRDATSVELRARFPNVLWPPWDSERPFARPNAWAAFTYTGA